MARNPLFVATIVALVFAAGVASAQEDTTPPVLLEFVVSPTTFDAGVSDITLSWCVTARDDLSGLTTVDVSALLLPDFYPTLFLRHKTFTSETLEQTLCDQVTIPQFTPYGTYRLQVIIKDQATNQANVNLCDQGFVCSFENRAGGGLPDADGDGVPDDADNCPNDSNEDQADADLDLIGDVCDPFPNDRDNEQAQCEADLADCLANGLDADGDGEWDLTDACPDTITDEPVDDSGCSQTQFCAKIDVTVRKHANVCLKSDWMNDEPLSNDPHDCVVDGGLVKGTADDTCVPYEE